MHSLAMAQAILEAAYIEAAKHDVKHTKAISRKGCFRLVVEVKT